MDDTTVSTLALLLCLAPGAPHAVDAAPAEKKVAASDDISLMLFEQRQGSLAFWAVAAALNLLAFSASLPT